jgi:hypothetical protein
MPPQPPQPSQPPQPGVHGTREATAGPGPQADAEGRQRRLIVRGIEVAAVVQYLGSRRFLERAIVGAIGLAALASLARENQARALSRFIAWEKHRNLVRRRTKSLRGLAR